MRADPLGAANKIDSNADMKELLQKVLYRADVT